MNLQAWGRRPPARARGPDDGHGRQRGGFDHGHGQTGAVRRPSEACSKVRSEGRCGRDDGRRGTDRAGIIKAAVGRRSADDPAAASAVEQGFSGANPGKEHRLLAQEQLTIHQPAQGIARLFKTAGVGKSSRKWAPREFSLARAARVMTRLMLSRFLRLSQSCQPRL